MDRRSRRQFLALGYGAAAAAAGCTSGRGESAPADGDCDRSEQRTPTLNRSPDNIRVRQYPTLPEDPTCRAAVSFAEAFERAYRQRRFLLNNPGTVEYVSVLVTDRSCEQAAGGYEVGLDYELKARVRSGPHHDAFHGVWYRITRDSARRVETRGRPPDGAFADARVVYCRGGTEGSS